jgi:chloramphenicol 3-O phosphotransferase
MAKLRRTTPVPTPVTALAARGVRRERSTPVNATALISTPTTMSDWLFGSILPAFRSRRAVATPDGANMGAAYRSLSEETRSELAEMRVVHDWMQIYFPAFANEDEGLNRVREKYPAQSHPLVLTHPFTGEKVLFSNKVSGPRQGDGADHPGRRTNQVTTHVIVLNGGSSSGKSGISRCLKHILPNPWINLGVDDLIDRLPPSMVDSGAGVALGQQGEVELGEGFHEMEHAWMTGIAAMAKAGARVIIDDVFLSGTASQERTRKHLESLDVLWVGVRCDPEIAAAREVSRGDRVIGMAASQAEIVHKGVTYDVEVDTSHTESLECARIIAAHVV